MKIECDQIFEAFMKYRKSWAGLSTPLFLQFDIYVSDQTDLSVFCYPRELKEQMMKSNTLFIIPAVFHYKHNTIDHVSGGGVGVRYRYYPILFVGQYRPGILIELTFL